MKYILFAWTAYGQEGGWNDFIGLFDTVGQADECFENSTCCAGQIVNATSLQVEKELEI